MFSSRSLGRSRSARARYGRFVSLGLTAGVALAACGDSTTAPEPVMSVVVSPPAVAVMEFDTARLSAVAMGANGRVLTGHVFVWRSDSTHVAAVDEGGLVRTLRAGGARIYATTGGQTGSATLTVSPHPVSTVEVLPIEGDLEVGDTLRLTALVRSSGGAILKRPVAWASERVDVATVDAEGLVTARGAGTVGISATAGGVSASAEIRVSAPLPVVPVVETLSPSTIQAGWSAFTLTVRGSGFVPQSRVTWDEVPLETFFVSGSELQATVSSSHVAAEGSAAVRVETPMPERLVSNERTFTIFSRPALTVELRVPGNTVFAGDAVRLSAVARDQFGQIIEGKRIDWTSSDTTIVRIEGEYLRGLRTGSVNLVASAYPTFSGMTYFVAEAPVEEIAFQGRATSVPEIFGRTLAPPGSVRRLLPPVTEARQPRPSPDGTRIAFVGRDGSGNEDIYVVEADGTGRVRLTTEPGPDDQPSWSPDGLSIAFRSFRHGKSDIWVMNADGSDQRNLTFADVFVPEEHNDRPSWSPDSRTLVFSRGFGLGQSLYTMGADGSGLSVLLEWSGLSLLEPAWSPDGAMIAFRRYDPFTGSSGIEFVDPSTRNLVWQLAPPPGGAVTPAWIAPGWIAVGAPLIPGTDIRTIGLVRLGFGNVVVPMGAEFGTLEEPAALPR